MHLKMGGWEHMYSVGGCHFVHDVFRSRPPGRRRLHTPCMYFHVGHTVTMYIMHCPVPGAWTTPSDHQHRPRAVGLQASDGSPSRPAYLRVDAHRKDSRDNRGHGNVGPCAPFPSPSPSPPSMPDSPRANLAFIHLAVEILRLL